MKPSISGWTAICFATMAQAIVLSERTTNPHVVALPIQKSKDARSTALHSSRLRRRQDVVTESLDNEQTTYFAEVELGTPAQTLQLHIDTGSSDLWVNVASSSLCESSQNACSGGTYDSSSSSTYKLVNNAFNISYVDGSAAIGDYAKDTLAIGGETLTGFQFGIGETSSSSAGVLGVGYVAIESQVGRSGLSTYPNLPQALVNAGLINVNGYSLWLNDLDANSGSIMFGGVNTAKYTGDLQSVPIIPVNGLFLVFAIAVSGLSVAGTTLSSSSSIPFAVILDSGSTLTYLPDDVTTDIFNTVNAVYDSNNAIAYVECNMASQDSSVDFIFSGITISVPYNELVLSQALSASGQPLTFQNGESACLFGISPSLGSSPILGDTFLRSAYVVYDLENNEISLAQTNFNGGTDDIREITKNGVPGATLVASPVTTLAAATGGRIGGATITESSTPTALSAGVFSREVPLAMAALLAVGAAFVML